MKRTVLFLASLMMAVCMNAEEVDTLAQKEFSLQVDEVELRVSETFQIELIWHYPEWVSAYGKFVTYSSGSDVVSVDDKGLITARRVGETYVYVSGNGVTRTCHVRVVEGEPGVVQHQKGRMTLPLGEFLDDQSNDFVVTLTDGILRLTGSFWGHACIPSELEYEILDGAAFFDIYTSYEDSTCTDGWQGSFMVRQTIDVSFEGCTSDVYNVYVNNVHYETYEEGAMNAIVYRVAPNRYGTDTNVNLNIEGDAEALTAEIGEDSIHITGYYFSNCGMDLYCIAEEQNGSIALTLYQVGVIGANCMGNHYVDFTIPRLAEQVSGIYACDPDDQSIRLEAKVIDTSIGHISTPAVDAPYYDLMGRKVTHPTRGLYIRNGRKVIVE